MNRVTSITPESALQRLEELAGKPALWDAQRRQAEQIADDCGLVLVFERLDLATWERRQWVFPGEEGANHA